MWIDNLHPGWGWHVCWQEGEEYWFFAANDLPEYHKDITWLASRTIYMVDGMWTPVNKNFADPDPLPRGEFKYRTRCERDKAWELLKYYPIPFIIRASLCG